MRNSASLTAVALLALSSARVSAQQPFPVAVGTRVRASVDTSRNQPTRLMVVGTLSALPPDSLVIAWDSTGSRTLALAKVTRLEVSRGQRTLTGRGALIGAFFGVFTGIALASADPGKSNNTIEVFTPAQTRLIGATLFGTVGAAVGALMGHAQREERWEAVALPAPR